MKKVILLMIVLALVSSASAALSWNINGVAANTYVATPGETLTITLSDTATNVAALEIAWLTDNLAGGSAVPGSVNATLSTGKDAGYQGGAFGMGDTAGDIISVYGAANPPTYATGILYTYAYTISSSAAANIPVSTLPIEGLNNLVTYSDASSVAIPSFVIQVPEPMTIALLGLGGLFLRRKLS